MRTNAFKLTALTSILAGLSACGGGGGDDTTLPTTLAFPVQAVYDTYLTTATNAALNGVVNGVSYQMTISNIPQPDAAFEGVQRKVLLETGMLKQGTTLLTTTSTFQFFSLNPTRTYGGVSTDGRYAVYTNVGSFPLTAKVGDTWPGYVGVVYKDATKVTKLIDLTQNWSLEPDTATTAYLCANTVQKSSTPTSTEAMCRRIDAAGKILGYRLTIMINGQSLTFS